MKRPRPSSPGRPAAPPAKAGPAPEITVTCRCPCGAPLVIPVKLIDRHGLCPRCRTRLLFTGRADARGRLCVQPLALAEGAPSGKTFVVEDRLEEMAAVPDKIPFHCPCGMRLLARPGMVDRRGKCSRCGARLLLVGKLNPRTRRMEIHPLVQDDPSTGDTFMFPG